MHSIEWSLALKLPTFTDHFLDIPVDDSDDGFERLDVKPRDIF